MNASPQTNTVHFSGIGIVAKTKDPDSQVITVYPHEVLSDSDGNVMDTSEIAGSTKHQTQEATYWELDPYSTIPPMVTEGDEVILLRHGDSDTYYWFPRKAVSTRQITHREHRYPAKKKQDTEDSVDNNYRTLIDTEEGILLLETTKDRDEPVSYTVQLSTADGILSLLTDTGDVLTWDSVRRTLNIETKTTTIKVTKLSIKGDVDIVGAVKITGDLQVSGSAKVGGSLSVGGNITASGAVTGSRGNFPNLD